LQFNQQINLGDKEDARPSFPQVRVFTIPDAEFDQLWAKPEYTRLSDGSLERLEGSLRIVIIRQSRGNNLLPE
jgi:hypothetical protein